MNRFVSWLLVLLLFGLFFVVAALALRARVEAGKGMPPYSVYAEGRTTGLAGTARLLRQLGYEPVAVTRPVQPARHRGLLILVEPQVAALLPGQTADLSDGDVRALLHWVRQGNTLLLAGRRLNALHRALNVEVTGEAADADDGWRDADVGESGYTEDLDRLQVHGRGTVRSGRGLPLWWVGDEPGAVLVPHGKGRVLVAADPTLLTPAGLARGDNIVFLYNVASRHAEEGKVWFDEYHHGLRSAGGFWGYLLHYDQGWILLPVVLAALAWAWAAAVRLGPPVPTPKSAGADAVDYASAVARIYRRAGARHLLAQGLARGFVAALTRHLRLPRSALPVEVLAAWRQRYPAESVQRLQPLLRGVGELRKGDVSERQLLGWATAFDQFQAEVLHAP